MIDSEKANLSPTDEYARGRAQALRIILELCPDDQLSGFTYSRECGGTGEYETHWDLTKLHELFHIDAHYKESPLVKLAEMADGLYWDLMAKDFDREFVIAHAARLVEEIDCGKVDTSPVGSLSILKKLLNSEASHEEL